jgi:hypothetical protein
MRKERKIAALINRRGQCFLDRCAIYWRNTFIRDFKVTFGQVRNNDMCKLQALPGIKTWLIRGQNVCACGNCLKTHKIA